MRTLYLVLLAFTLFGCEYRNIEINGTAPGMDGWTVTIGRPGKMLFGENIQNGKFHVGQQLLKESGYYSIVIGTPGKMPHGFEVYLEPGKYDIAISDKDPSRYPIIKSPSAIQNGLSAYYPLRDSLTSYARSQYDLWLKKMDDPNARNWPQSVYDNVLNNVNSWRDSVDNMKLTIFKTLVKKQPDNPAIPHILKGLSITQNPSAFYKIFKEVSSDVRNSPEGKKIDKRLEVLTSLSKGAKAPKLVGQTPDGKEIDITALNKKAIIIDFWQSNSSITRAGQEAILKDLLPKYKNDIGVVSVCLGTDRDKWIEYIKKQKLTWLQINDLKGSDSPNVSNWNLSILPIYYLLDGKGHIIEPDMDYKQLVFTLEEYMAKH